MKKIGDKSETNKKKLFDFIDKVKRDATVNTQPSKRPTRGNRTR